MTMKSGVITTVIVGLSLFLGACDWRTKKPEAPKKDFRQEVVVRAAPSKLTLESLDKRVSVLEEARAKAKAAAASRKFTPAPKYDPHFNEKH